MESSNKSDNLYKTNNLWVISSFDKIRLYTTKSCSSLAVLLTRSDRRPKEGEEE